MISLHSETPQSLALATSHRADLHQAFATCQILPLGSSCMPVYTTPLASQLNGIDAAMRHAVVHFARSL
jgi:hypothetical protein